MWAASIRKGSATKSKGYGAMVQFNKTRSSLSMRYRLLSLAVCLFICYSSAAIGGFFTAGAVQEWYPTLVKPSWNPPAWVFGPVWSLLYGMMAVAVWLIWGQRGGAIAVPITFFALQLLLNAAWSPLFFGLQNTAAALFDIVLLWLSIAATLWLFLKRSKLAGLLLVPYLLWVSFAAVLNFSIWQLNR